MRLPDLIFLEWFKFLAQLCLWPSFKCSGSFFLSLYRQLMSRLHEHMATEKEKRGRVSNGKIACLQTAYV